MTPQHGAVNITTGTAEQNNEDSKREELLGDANIPPADDASSTAEFNGNKDHKLWKLLMRARGNDITSNNKMSRDSSPEIVDIYAVHRFQVSFSLSCSRLCSY